MRIHELGHVVFYVSNIAVVADFYRDTLGFTEIVRQSGMALFSGGRTHHEMLLIEVGGTPSSREAFPRPVSTMSASGWGSHQKTFAPSTGS